MVESFRLKAVYLLGSERTVLRFSAKIEFQSSVLDLGNSI